ncbi:VanZ family protein [Streptomyces tubercidicus]|uniref:VanZ family protein n=1 Tax=Streptomyces tubercidicus TaxID=47759 RepID=A0A640UWB6_9ACTN|nr:VanZ family protein [Streptomyces tubercidicus]WAU13165.1 VanZ family protein [Streptomyces tubercidicus]GFE38725.1 VanZ family protein [Streptomyces tubercidicus]
MAHTREGDEAAWSPVAARAPLAVRILLLVLAFAAMVAFAAALARVTLTPSAVSVPLTHPNLSPGDSIRGYLGQPQPADTVKQLGGNVLLGLPFGVLLPVLVPRARGLVRVGAATALVMLLVELVQGALITGRAFDIDDVILNCAGALIGYLLLGRRLGRAVHPRRRHWWHRLGARGTAGPVKAPGTGTG